MNALLNAIHHPKFVPVIVALILAVAAIWVCAAILRSQEYTPCVDRGESLIGTLCP